MGSASATDPRPKRRIGRYTVTGRLGRGGMGTVYRGHDELLDREVAIKTLTVEATLDAESRRRFEIEARASARLQHPNILTVYELGDDRGVAFIAMELLHGADLESVMRSGQPLSVHEILEVVIQVARGLAYAHDHGIVHRDIKPTNVRLLDDGTVKIMDFGIAKLGGTNLTKTGMMLGTVYYMSPEQIQAKPLDGRSDVFSVGVILHELLAGQRPFPGANTTQVLYKIVHEDAPPLRVSLGPVSAALEAIVSKALARDPGARYESASRLADALAEALATHLGHNPPGTTTEDLDIVNEARGLVRSGQTPRAVRELEALLARRPGCVEARRTWRAASRVVRPADPDAYTELDATFQSPPTQKQPSPAIDEPAPTVQYARATPVSEPAAPSGRGLWLAASAAVLVAIGAFVLFLRAEQPVAALAPTLAAAAPVTLPEGARSLPAVERAEPVRRTERAVPRSTTTPAVSVSVPGTISVRSSYPVDVTWQGRTLARATASPTVEVNSGRQTLSLVSAEHFLRRTLSVDVPPGGSVAIEAPALGRLSIKASPDNCEVSIDGVFADYPPILDRAVASGTHTVSFKWPDGTRREEEVEVTAGRAAYVTGRKD